MPAFPVSMSVSLTHHRILLRSGRPSRAGPWSNKFLGPFYTQHKARSCFRMLLLECLETPLTLPPGKLLLIQQDRNP